MTDRISTIATAFALFIIATVLGVAEEGLAQWPPKGTPIKCPVIRDTLISSVEGEQTGNNGAAQMLKLKGMQEYSLIDIDPERLKGRLITGALLHLRSASPEKAPLARVGVSSVATEWIEGGSQRYRPETGSSCYNQAAFLERDWAYPGSTLMDAAFGHGNTLWRFADCTHPDQAGWQAVAVEPDVVALRVARISKGFMLYDEVGHEWSCENGKFEWHVFPNRFFYSRESFASAPWLEVWLHGTDTLPPNAIERINVEKPLPSGESVLSWKTPTDRGPGKTIGYFATYEYGGSKREIPQYLVPLANKPEEMVRMHFRDLDLPSGEMITITISPVDSAGNVGGATSKTFQQPSPPKPIELPEVELPWRLPNHPPQSTQSDSPSST